MTSLILNVNNKFHEQHPFHLVNPSIRPFFVSWGVFCGVLILLSLMHASSTLSVGSVVSHAPYAPIIFLAYHIYGWFADIMVESRVEKAHTQLVQQGMGAGMALFIASEVMFFFAFFWAIFHFSVSPAITSGAVWPSAGIQAIDPFGVPLINTLLLLSSGVTLTFAHRYLTNMRVAPGLKTATFTNLLQANNLAIITISPKKNISSRLVTILLGGTILLGCIFLLCQAYEYINAPYTLLDGVYPSAFFLSTGFHGFHVLCGTLFLIVCLRLLQKSIYSSKRHLTFEFAAWYWHFVDVVWILLYISLYCLSPLS